MTTEKTQKSAVFFICEKCDYKSSKRSDYNRHILTPKHKNTTFIQLKTQQKPTTSQHFHANVGNPIHIRDHYIIIKRSAIFLEKKTQKSAHMNYQVIVQAINIF
jgi:hypothetical protein